MSEIIWVPPLVLSCVLVPFYWNRCRRARIKFNIGVMVNTVLNAYLMVGGVLWIVGIFWDEIKQLMDDTGVYNAYTVIGGTTLIVVAIQNFYREVIEGTQK